jgi:hypothetical protein
MVPPALREFPPRPVSVHLDFFALAVGILIHCKLCFALVSVVFRVFLLVFKTLCRVPSNIKTKNGWVGVAVGRPAVKRGARR